MKIRIITVGKSQPEHLRALESGYEKRMQQLVSVSWVYVNPAGLSDPTATTHKEAAGILRYISANELIILLDERGDELSSPELAGKLDTWLSSGKDVVVIIGGAYGVDASIRERADFVWSLSRLVFPHQLVRTILSEQLYRAFTIRQGLPYHHA